jgi:hypothetical protein
MHIDNAPGFSTAEEHIAELYRRIDGLSDRIESLDLVFYPICLAIRFQSPLFFDEITSGMETVHQQKIKEAAEADSPIDPNKVYALERFLATAKLVRESAENVQSEVAAAGKPAG